MMGGYAALFIGLLVLGILLGYALIVLAFANKESGWLKIAGQIIAWAIAVLAIIMFLYTAFYGGRMGGMMGGPCMMMQGGKGMEMMEKMMKSPEMQKYMQQRQAK